MPVALSPFMNMLSPTPTVENTSLSPQQIRLKEIVRNQWKQLSYSIFQNLMSVNQKNNSWICVPHVVSNLLFLAKCVGPVPARALLSEMIDDRKLETNSHVQAAILNLLLEEFLKWEQRLEEFAVPANFWSARRLLVSPNFPKSYRYQSFTGFKVFKVEICILPEKTAFTDIADWIKKQLKHAPLNWPSSNAETNTANDEVRNLFVLWKPLVDEENETRKVKRKRHIKIKHRSTEKEEMTPVNKLRESNEKVPILAWISHYQIVFGSKLLDTERLYYILDQPKCLFFRLSDSTPKIRYANADRLEAYEIPCLNTNQVVYIIKGLSAVEQFENIQDMIDRTAKEKSSVKTIYIPIWKSPETATNMAKSIKATIDNDLLFAPNGFGDLAAEDGEASAENDSNLSSNIQHFDVISVKHEPDRSKIAEIQEGSSDVCRIIDIPYTVVIWDRVEAMPIYMGRVNQPISARSNSPDAEEKSGPVSSKCVIT